MRNNYKSGTKDMTDEQVLAAIHYHHKYLMNDCFSKNYSTSHLTKSCYFKSVANKRGYTDEQITDYCNKRDYEEYKKGIAKINSSQTSK